MGDWGKGWPDCDRSKLAKVRRDDGMTLVVRQELAELVAMLCDRTEALGVDLVPGHCWGFACRAVRGSDVPSNHSWGTAVDLNAPANPMATAKWHSRYGNNDSHGRNLKTQFSPEIVELWTSHGFVWGGHWTRRPDPMHFEFAGTRADAARYTDALRGAPAPEPAAEKKPAEPKPAATNNNDDDGDDTVKLPTLSRGATGASVRAVQAITNDALGASIKTDGIFGPTTERMVKRFQSRNGLADDGIVGPKTWGALLL